MGDTNTPISRYAIMIGINAYQEKPLEGSVRDVQRIKRYLEETSTSIQIEMLTATRSDDLEARGLMEPQQIWPTHQNVLSALKRVVSSAKAGDLVYIHYSGHGTRTGATFPYSNSSTGDLALVLLDEHNEGREKYLYGAVLASHLKQMVDKELVVTLVLDCCFSATVYRCEDSKVRCLPYNPDLSLTATTFTETCLETSSYAGNRDASMLPNWLINPDGYAILAACGPHEVAKEIDPGNGQMQGALSYFLLSFIEISGPWVRHDAIYKHLCSKFRELGFHEQTPIMYGNRNQAFFQQSNFENARLIISIIMNQDGRLVLSTGDAHGICVGDCFALQHVNSERGYSLPSGHSVSARAVQVGPLTSNVELLEGAPTLTQTGWFATGYPQAYFQKYPVRLASDLPHSHELLAAFEAQSLSCHMNEEQAYSFYITMDNNSQYEIHESFRENHRKIENLPDMVQGKTEFGSISNIIKHLVRYSFTRDLTNNIVAEGFQQSFDARIISPSHENYAPGHLIETDEGVKHHVVVTNKGKTALYIYLYNLGPSWQIVNILKGCEVIPPPNPDLGFSEFKKKISTKVPVELIGKGLRQCEDVIKVLITSQPTSFDLLELPRLSKFETGRSTRRATIRSSQHGCSDTSENWAALNFPIRTFAR